MVQNLSKREKILLFSAALLVILYLSIQFVILPLITSYISKLDERSHLRTVQSRVDADIANKSTIEAEHKDAEQRFESVKQQYPLLVSNEEVVTILNNLCIINGLSPSRLNITSPPYPAQTEGAEELLFTIITATMNVSGFYQSLVSLLDEVDTKQFIRVTNMNYTVNRQSDSALPTPSTITLNFELTFVNP